jgi:hypothetical protein
MPNEYPIKLGSLLFTLVEPRKGHEVEYNRWYERDHFYAGCMIGPWQFAGQRFMATRADKARQAPGPNPVTGEGGRGSYLAIYWVLAGHHDEWNRWAVDQVNRLHAEGRMFNERDHVHTALYNNEFVAERDAAGVPIELAFDHRYPGLVAVVGQSAEGVDPAEASAWFRDEFLPGEIAGSAVAQVLHALPRPLLADAPGDVPRAEGEERRFCQLWFCEEPALDVWDAQLTDLAERVGAGGKAEILWASPFRPTVVGTDTYVDELW